jgi:hypothetical protein
MTYTLEEGLVVEETPLGKYIYDNMSSDIYEVKYKEFMEGIDLSKPILAPEISGIVDSKGLYIGTTTRVGAMDASYRWQSIVRSVINYYIYAGKVGEGIERVSTFGYITYSHFTKDLLTHDAVRPWKLYQINNDTGRRCRIGNLVR